MIEVRNQADGVIYSVEKTLRDYSEKISGEVQTEITAKLETLKQAKESSDVASIKVAMNDLQQSVYKLSEAIYREAAETQAKGPKPGPKEEPKPESGEQGEGGADYRVVDEEPDKE